MAQNFRIAKLRVVTKPDFLFLTAPLAKIQKSGFVSARALAIPFFAVFLKKIGWETKKFMHLQIWWSSIYISWGHQTYFVIYYSLASSVFERLFSISWGGCLSVGGVVLRLDCLARQLIMNFMIRDLRARLLQNQSFLHMWEVWHGCLAVIHETRN